MCGIAGIFTNNGNADSTIVRRMTDAMSHRGPDASGVFQQGSIAFGHRRLSIIDLSELANQPFFDQAGRYILVFNGEIYNYREVKKELTDYPFRTNSDTEMIIAAFTKWGIDSLTRFKGMFALAIWDKVEEKLTIARDRFGVKPMYYFQDSEVFAFSSEIRSILASGLVKPGLSADGLHEYFSFQSIGTPKTLIRDIYQLGSGEYMEVRGNKIAIKTWWTPLDNTIHGFNDDIGTVHKKIRELLAKSVERRLIADVPVGAFLSGGIDSSAVVGLMAEVGDKVPNTFNIYFDEEEYNEREYAEIVAKKFKTNHTAIHMKPGDFLADLMPALKSLDTPSGDGVNTYVVSKAIRKAGMTVALSGIGGDELFAGYPVFHQYIQFKKFAGIWPLSGPFRHLASRLVGNGSNRRQRIAEILRLPSLDIKDVYPVSREILTAFQIEQFTNIPLRKTDLEMQLTAMHKNLIKLPSLSQVSVAEFMGYTQQTLLKDTDQMSMAVSLEIREPFFDHDLVEYVLSIPDAIKKPAYPKQLLVESLGELLPKEIVHRKKKGFSFPWKLWMRNELKEFCTHRIQAISQRSFIRPGILERAWQRFLQGDDSMRWAEFWLFIVLEEWLTNNGIEE